MSRPADPEVLGNLSMPGGVRGASFVPSSTLTDRLGGTVTGTFAGIVGGDVTTGGRLHLLDISTPASPVLLGSAQLTAVPNGTPSSQIPDLVGTPRDVVVTADLRGLVAVENVGLVSVNLGQTIPDDPANGGQALGPRYPATGSESVHAVTLLGERAVIAGAMGLTVLDTLTLERVGVVETGQLHDVAVLPSFALDLDGDGTTSHLERIDLAVATGGDDGTLQFFRLPTEGNPQLLSAIRFTGETAGVVVDGDERLAYVGLGARGAALVDLDGPASVQPLDIDRNGVDDRILGSVAVSGHARRIALDLSRGVGYLAGGPAGLVTLRLLPPRTRFLTLRRDPLRAFGGDEESILDTRRAFVTDEALVVSLSALLPPVETAYLVIDKASDDGLRLLSFEGTAAISSPLSDGLNERRLAIDQSAPLGERDFALAVRSATGATLAKLEGRLVVADLDSSPMTRLVALPTTGVIGPAEDHLQISVGGLRESGQFLNLTRQLTGTTYEARPALVAAVEPDGRVTPQAGGTALIEITNRSLSTNVQVTVGHPPVAAALVADPAFVTLRAIADRVTLSVFALMSDGTTRPATSLAGVQFVSSNPTVAVVDNEGDVIALSEGTTVISVTNGSVAAELAVHVELRHPTTVTSIRLEPIPAATVDDGRVLLTAVLEGTGSLDGLLVTFSADGLISASLPATSGLVGRAAVQVSPLTAGAFVVLARVTDPATGEIRTATSSLSIASGSLDTEPNGDQLTAAPLRIGPSVSGSIGGGDASDTFRVESSLAGSLTLKLSLNAGAEPSGLVVIVRDASGSELTRIHMDSLSVDLVLPVGAAFLTIESAGATASYEASLDFDQADVVITSVSPATGSPGTAVAILGSGFSARPADNIVFFGNVPARVVTASPSRLDVMVPANAINGPVEVVVRSRRSVGPQFMTGSAGPLPAPFVAPVDPAAIRQDPVSRRLVDVTRFLVTVDPQADRTAVEQSIQPLGGSIVGIMPTQSRYVLEFKNIATLAVHAERRRILQLMPVFTMVASSTLIDFSTPTLLDIRDTTQADAETLTAAYRRVNLIDAVEAIRSTPPFTNRAEFTDPKVAIIDDGFKPIVGGEFTNPQGDSVRVFDVVSIFGPGGFTFQFNEVNTSQKDSHGSAVASVIVALNNGNELNGVLNGVVNQGETPFRVDLTRPGLTHSASSKRPTKSSRHSTRFDKPVGPTSSI